MILWEVLLRNLRCTLGSEVACPTVPQMCKVVCLWAVITCKASPRWFTLWVQSSGMGRERGERDRDTEMLLPLRGVCWSEVVYCPGGRKDIRAMCSDGMWEAVGFRDLGAE